MKTNLKLLKYDIKQILPVPAALLTICTLLNIVLMISVAAAPDTMFSEMSDVVSITASQLALGIIAATVIYQLSKRIFKSLNITRLTNCNLIGVYSARLLLLFIVMFAATLLLVLENTALHAVLKTPFLPSRIGLPSIKYLICAAFLSEVGLLFSGRLSCHR